MARYMIRQDDQWPASAGEDVRGWPVQDRDGRIVGIVEDVYIDANTGQVESVVTASGREIPASEYRIGEHVLLVNEPIGTGLPRPHKAAEDSLQTTSHIEPPPDSFEAMFYAHFEQTYGHQSERVFMEYLPAYQFGRAQSLQPTFYGRSFERAEEDLCALFELHYPNDPYEWYRESIRFGYELGSRIKVELDTGILEHGKEGPPAYELDRNQIRPVTEEPGIDQAHKTSAVMSIPGAQSDRARSADEGKHKHRS